MPYRVIEGQWKHFFNDVPLTAGQIVKIELEKNDYDSEANYLKESHSVVLITDRFLPDNFKVLCNADGSTDSTYKVTDPDNETWQFSISYGDGSPVSIADLRAGGSPPSDTDTVLSLIEDRIADKADKLGTNETVSGTSYTLTANDLGKVKRFTNAAAITLTIPLDLPAGFNCAVVQTGNGQITFAGASGVILDNPLSHTKSIKNGMVTIYSYAADSFIFQGATE